MIVSGDITEITFNHPKVGSGTLYPKAAEDSEFDTGGFRSADDASAIVGSGKRINKLNRVCWMLSTTVGWDMNDAEELEKLTELAGEPEEAQWTISHANGSVYGGSGSVVGDVKGNGNTGLIPLKLQGSDKMKKIV